jgi:protein-disulfide isomerase
VKVTNLVTVALLAMTTVSPSLFAATNPMPDEQKKQIEQIVHDYLVHNPEVLVEVSQVLQQKQQQSMVEQAKGAITQNADQLFLGGMTVAGNPNGSVTLVEFFDYQCVHCKEMKPVIDELIKSDKNLRVIYKEFPIFGKTSEIASRAALAAAMQGKYDVMHQALLKMDKRMDETVVMTAAKSAGLNLNKLKIDMSSKEVTDALAANRTLAEKLRLMGTPAFIIASTPGGKFKVGSTPLFVPGAATTQALQDMIKKASS